MIKRKGYIGTKWITLMLILSVGLLTANKTIFFHAHILKDGKIIYHSHPYQKNSDSSPYKHHHHNSTQLTSIDQSDLLFFQNYQCKIPVQIEEQILWENKQLQFFISIKITLGDRAPPALQFS